MVFCPNARGPCPGRVECKLWIRGRILYTDSKLLAAQLSRLIFDSDNPHPSLRLTPRILETFWKDQGIPNIQNVIVSDRYLREKVAEVEALAQLWIQSSGFHKKLLDEKQGKIKASSELHKPHCKSPP